MSGADELGGAAELGARAGRRDLRHRLAAPHQRSGIGLHARAGFDGHRFAGEHGLVEQDFSPGEVHIRGDHARRAKASPRRPAPVRPRVSVFQAPSRRTDAFSASRDFSAARVAWARLSWNSPSAALNTRRPAMIAASTYLPSASSSTIAASSIHGTGAQNFSSAMRNGCSARIRHRVGAELLQPAARFVARQAARKIILCDRCRFGEPGPCIGRRSSRDHALPYARPPTLAHLHSPTSSLAHQ